MSYRSMILFSLAACLALCFGGCTKSTAETPEESSREATGDAGPEKLRDASTLIPKRVREILADPARFEFLTTDPNRYGDFDPAKDNSPHIHGFKIVSETTFEASDLADRQKLVGAFYAAVQASNGQRAKCFVPRHAIRAAQGSDLVEMVICFECYATRIYFNGELVETVSQTKYARDIFNTIAAAHGLKVHGQPQPKSEG